MTVVTETRSDRGDKRTQTRLALDGLAPKACGKNTRPWDEMIPVMIPVPIPTA